ncbi:MAG TPA: AAA family ATPase [Saprospiraceae bacterium]|nr:AAA family ATPase [Saprospiraceae bacterium]
MVQVLRDIGVNVNDDEDQPSHNIPLSEIDPFTFLFFLGKTKNDWNKIKIIRELCRKWEIDHTVNDVCGIPSPNAQKLWMFRYKHSRGNEISILWNLFDKLISDTITDADFAVANALPTIGKTKLTESFFIVKPLEHLCINAKVKPFLVAKGINPEFSTFTEYKSVLNAVRNVTKEPFYEISYQAYLASEYDNQSPNYYRIGTTVGENGMSILPEMLDNGIASIGWKELGNLYLIDPFNRKHVGDALQHLVNDPYDKRTASRKGGEIVQFMQEIKPGDYVLAAKGTRIKAIGKVISHIYIFDANLNFPHGRCVDWLYPNVTDLQITEGIQTSVWKFSKSENLNIIQKYLDGVSNNRNEHSNVQTNNIKKQMELNSILVGPPGTGKTFHSISYAVAIVEGKTIETIVNEERGSVKKRFDRYLDDGQIVYCTFHQSLSYEDFIEGLKPIEPASEDEELTYAVEDGIFKRLCTEAAFSFVQMKINTGSERILDFSSEYDRFVDAVNERFSKGERIELESRSGGNVYIESISQKNNIWVSHIDGKRRYTVSKKRLSKISQAFPELNEVTNINDQFRAEIGGSNSSAYWAVLNAIRKQPDEVISKDTKTISEKEYSYDDKKEIIQSLNNDDYKIENPKKFVLIIDEINRGNVSQIFGELITLIEDDKRLGKEEALKAKLPYSKDSFGVPCNISIIGTMNTADRSVEALDTALRRRFSFVPMAPKPEELKITADDINLPEILRVLNNRLSVLKDSDHTLGHAWLWNVSDLNSLKIVFRDKILPLLQEYFYNDYEKLGLVLGDAFFQKHEQINSNIFAPFTGGNGLASQYDQIWKYKLKSVDALTIEDFKSLEQLYNMTGIQ